jgi:hypothetical protein
MAKTPLQLSLQLPYIMLPNCQRLQRRVWRELLML